ncbi:MAG: hypothetical protein KJS68_16525 [Alphaproteobacteria bacterium]|nr:hypothetical protein [Alphaproteobacteria bacterium]
MPHALARRADARHHARSSQTIDMAWIDNVVHELVHALKRQLSRFKNIEHRAGAAKSPAAMARALVAMEQMLERLLRLEKEREQARAMRTENVDDARAALEARLDERLAFIEEQERREAEEEERRCEEMIETMAVTGTA